MNTEQLRAAKRINDDMIDFLDLFFGLGGVGEAEEMLFEADLEEEELEDTMDDISRLVLEELSYIQTRIIKEYFYLKGTSIYKAYSDFFSKELCTLVDDWQNGVYEINSDDQEDYINSLFEIAERYAAC